MPGYIYGAWTTAFWLGRQNWVPARPQSMVRFADAVPQGRRRAGSVAPYVPPGVADPPLVLYASGSSGQTVLEPAFIP